MIDHARLARLHEHWIDYPGYPLEPDFPREEYALRLARARERMARAGLDALVVTSGSVGQWFTSALEPHEWHDRCAARSAWFVLTHDEDYLYMTPTTGGEHFNTTRRSSTARR
jgi:Xaa-Pro aminopeptidase